MAGQRLLTICWLTPAKFPITNAVSKDTRVQSTYGF